MRIGETAMLIQKKKPIQKFESQNCSKSKFEKKNTENGLAEGKA